MVFTPSVCCAGSLCHANGTLAVLDTTVLDLHCNFPYQALSNLTSLSSLVLQFSRPDQVPPLLPPIAHASAASSFPLSIPCECSHCSDETPKNVPAMLCYATHSWKALQTVSWTHDTK